MRYKVTQLKGHILEYGRNLYEQSLNCNLFQKKSSLLNEVQIYSPISTCLLCNSLKGYKE